MATTLRKSFVAVDTQIASSATAYVTTSATEVVTIDKMTVYNVNTTTEVIKIYIDTAGEAPAAANQYLEVSVAAATHLDITEAVNLTLGNTQSIFLLTTTASKVNLHISGRRIVG